jgi:hypothetical protein
MFSTIKTCENAMDAHILKAAIEAEGITCYLFDENIVTINPLYNITVGGIKLAVADADFEAAVKLLTTIESRPYLDDENKEVTCPSCHSTAIDMSLDYRFRFDFFGFIYLSDPFKTRESVQSLPN